MAITLLAMMILCSSPATLVVQRGVEATVGRALEPVKHCPHLKGYPHTLSAPPTYCNNHTYPPSLLLLAGGKLVPLVGPSGSRPAVAGAFYCASGNGAF